MLLSHLPGDHAHGLPDAMVGECWYLVHSAFTARFLGHEAAPGPSGPSSLLQSPEPCVQLSGLAGLSMVSRVGYRQILRSRRNWRWLRYVKMILFYDVLWLSDCNTLLSEWFTTSHFYQFFFQVWESKRSPLVRQIVPVCRLIWLDYDYEWLYPWNTNQFICQVCYYASKHLPNMIW